MGLMDPEDEKEELEEYFDEDEKKPSFMKQDEGSRMDQHNEGSSREVREQNLIRINCFFLPYTMWYEGR